ncbi:hypothetical protein L7F22_005317 [Adiantum nelumboides]|nr:hypothetical protein [Adiantum nelumboides]
MYFCPYPREYGNAPPRGPQQQISPPRMRPPPMSMCDQQQQQPIQILRQSTYAPVPQPTTEVPSLPRDGVERAMNVISCEDKGEEKIMEAEAMPGKQATVAKESRQMTTNDGADKKEKERKKKASMSRRKIGIIKFQVKSKPHDLIEEVQRQEPKLTWPQLLHLSPRMRRQWSKMVSTRRSKSVNTLKAQVLEDDVPVLDTQIKRQRVSSDYVDGGAQMCVIGEKMMHKLRLEVRGPFGFKGNDGSVKYVGVVTVCGIQFGVDMYVLPARGEGYPIILGRPWLIAMNARQDWESRTLLLKPPRKEGKSIQTIVYNVKEGRKESLELETSEDEWSTEDSSSKAEVTSSVNDSESDKSSLLEAMGVVLTRPTTQDGGSIKETLSDEKIEDMLSTYFSKEERKEFEVMLQKHLPLFILDYKQIKGVTVKVEEGLQRLNGFGGKLNPDKCHIGEDEVILLGHKISQRGIEVDLAKAKALLELPSPKSIKEVTSFMQKVKYMARFIHLASELLHPLQKLTQQVEFAWSEDLEEYFKSIKIVLSELPTLMPPCWDFPFFVNPSVGVESIGAILLQQDPQSSRMRPMYFTSRVTTNIEKGYSEAELMMLSLIFAVRKFRSYLLTKPFVILTSENLLPWVSSQMTMSSRISKWLMELQSYEYTFKPLPPPPPKVLSNAYTLFFDGAFRRATGKAGGGLVLVNPEGEVVMKEQVTLDGSTSNNETEYDILISGLKICLAQKIRRLMVKGDALLIVKQILGIWACKNERLKTKVTSIRKLFSQFEEVQLYHIPRKENEDAYLLAQQAVSNQDRAHVVIAAIALKDPQYAGFRRGLLTEVCEELKISHRHSTPYYPQSNGLVEKANGIIAGIIRQMVESKPKRWDNFLDGAIWAYKTTYRDATQFTPFHLVYGQEALQPIELNIPTIKLTGRQEQSNDEAWIDRLLNLVELE